MGDSRSDRLAQPELRSFVALSDDFRERRTTPREFLDGCLERIDRLDDTIRAFVALNRDAAMEAADASSRRWHDGSPRSPVDGMPIAVKDVIETRDMPTGQGSPLFAGQMTLRDAACVFALRQAGAVILGKAATTEFAATSPASTRHPLDSSRTPGGSSSGSAAAVALGMVPAALGTQVVGSIVRPASYCGVYGLKPGFGALNRGGCNDHLSQSCLGVLGASLPDVWAVAQEIGRRVGGDPGHRGLEGAPQWSGRLPRRLLALTFSNLVEIDPGVREVFSGFLSCLSQAGVQIVDAEEVARCRALQDALSHAFKETRQILAWENLWPLGAYAARDEAALSADAKQRLSTGRAMNVESYREALRRRDIVRRDYEDVIGDFDAAISLAATGAAPHGLERTGNPILNVPASYLGVPALSLPLLVHDGLPLGIQLVGKAAGEAALVDAGHALAALKL